MSPSATAVCSASLAPNRNSPATPSRAPARSQDHARQNAYARALTDTASFRENRRPTVVATPPVGRRDDDHAVLSGSVNAPLAARPPMPSLTSRRNMAENGRAGGGAGAWAGTRAAGSAMAGLRPGQSRVRRRIGASGTAARRTRTDSAPRAARPGAGFPGWPCAVAQIALGVLRRGHVGDAALVAVQDGVDAGVEAVDVVAQHQLAGVVDEGGLVGEVHHRPVDELEGALVAGRTWR